MGTLFLVKNGTKGQHSDTGAKKLWIVEKAAEIVRDNIINTIYNNECYPNNF